MPVELFITTVLCMINDLIKELDDQPVRSFSCFTGDLEVMAGRLVELNIRQWSWNPPVFTGYRPSRSSNPVGLK